jgi:hypothetical protein
MDFWKDWEFFFQKFEKSLDQKMHRDSCIDGPKNYTLDTLRSSNLTVFSIVCNGCKGKYLFDPDIRWIRVTTSCEWSAAVLSLFVTNLRQKLDYLC